MSEATPTTWYFHREGVKQGPVTAAQLRQLARTGGLAREDKVWKDGLSDWIEASKVRGLFDGPPDASGLTTDGSLQPAWRDGGDATGGVIPYKNPPALIAYYLGIVALLPALGLLFGIIAFTLGIIGLRKRRANPLVKGSIHAWIGIVLGGGSVLVHVALVILYIVVVND
ncbi:MAG: DUF4339 domain-containing protein [Phycisphaerales bacterium]|nr:MAG: DUF4339 domain-containing protein [Phycisphaerales bacterium]